MTWDGLLYIYSGVIGRQGSATGHKRQIGNNGRVDRVSANIEDNSLDCKNEKPIALTLGAFCNTFDLH